MGVERVGLGRIERGQGKDTHTCGYILRTLGWEEESSLGIAGQCGWSVEYKAE